MGENIARREEPGEGHFESTLEVPHSFAVGLTTADR